MLLTLPWETVSISLHFFGWTPSHERPRARAASPCQAEWQATKELMSGRGRSAAVEGATCP